MFENLTLPHLEQRAGISITHTKQHDIMGCMSFLYGTFANVPEMVNAGCITGHFVSFEASEDQDFIPDEKPLSGTVNITPTVGIMRWPTAHPRRMAVMSAIVCPIIYGDVYPPGTTVEDVDENIIPPGVWVVATDQPEGEPDLVQYTVSFRLDNARVQPDNLTINVPTNGVLDLADVVSASPVPGTITVVSSADRILAEQAANAAILAQQQAEAAANRAETARDQAVTAKNLAEGFAGDAETALTSTLAAAVYELRGEGQPGSSAATNDALPGTYYTDTAGAWRWLKTSAGSGVAQWTVVYGDTGWRRLDSLALNGWAINNLRIRRTGNIVHMAAYQLNPSAATSDDFLAMPDGFRPYLVTAIFPIRTVNLNMTGAVLRAPRGAVLLAEGFYSFTWLTSVPWPTTLPGTRA